MKVNSLIEDEEAKTPKGSQTDIEDDVEDEDLNCKQTSQERRISKVWTHVTHKDIGEGHRKETQISS